MVTNLSGTLMRARPLLFGGAKLDDFFADLGVLLFGEDGRSL
jgi:hypothetical protein